MSRQPETLFSQRFTRELKKIPGIAFDKLADRARVGIPDYIICVNGLMFLVELKVPGGKLAAIQKYTLERYKKAGATVFVLYPAEMDNFITALELQTKNPDRNTGSAPSRDSLKSEGIAPSYPKSTGKGARLR